MRSIIQALTTEIFGQSISLQEIEPPRPDIVGIGMSCWDGYALRLPHRLNYTNTFYHQEPFFDVKNAPPHMEGTLDFIISTDVFEHVTPPVSPAFSEVRKILKPDGVFIFSVPFTHPRLRGIPTKEHFPNLYSYKITEENGSRILENITEAGEYEKFSMLIFHGGPGDTLEMRVFSEAGLLANLQLAGFNDITIYSKPHLKHGIRWPTELSIPMAARTRPGSKVRIRRR